MSGGLADRGVGFQAAGFALVWLASTTILELFEGSNFWLYQWFERATVDTYWSSLVPLAFLFDWMRRMFQRGSEIRAAKRAEIMAKMRQQLGAQIQEEMREQVQQEVREQVQQEVREQVQQEVREQVQQEVREQVRQEVQEQVRREVRTETERIRQALLESPDVILPAEVADAIFGDSGKNGS